MLKKRKSDGTERKSGREIIVGKLKTSQVSGIVLLNETAIQAIIELRNERYFGEDATVDTRCRRKLYKTVELYESGFILYLMRQESRKRVTACATPSTKTCNWCESENGTVKVLTPRQVADSHWHTTSR